MTTRGRARESRAKLQARADEIVARLEMTYPDARCSLTHADPFQLLVATILSAQCTDARVNLVTPTLFARYPSARALADADPGELEGIIQSTGFFRSKTRNLLGMARAVEERHGGWVPRTMDELVALPGVGRKTANVVLGNAFGIDEGIVVDTHVARLSARLGLTRHTDPVKIEHDLVALVPRARWTLLPHSVHRARTLRMRRPHPALRGVCGERPLSVVARTHLTGLPAPSMPSKTPASAGRYWLVKSEPDCFSFDDLWRAPKRTTFWDGVRNYQARNILRDQMRRGDQVFYYHSSVDPPAIVGIAQVVGEGAPDPTAFDPREDHFDPASDPDAPRWFGVRLRAVRPLARPIPLAELRRAPALERMVLLQRGSRLSVQPVTAQEWQAVLALEQASAD